MRACCGPRFGRGFTLLEVLVALSIFALMSVIGYQALAAVLDTRTRLDQQFERLASVQRAITWISRDVEQAIARPVRGALGEPLAPLLGGGARGSRLIELTRSGWPNPAGLPRSTLQRVAYRLEQGRLSRETWTVLDRAADSAAARVMLLDGVRRLELRFRDQAGLWHAAWPPSGSLEPLPRAVEVAGELDGWGSLRRLLVLAPGGAAR